MKVSKLFAAFVVSLGFTFSLSTIAYAQGLGASGSIRGTVSDPQGSMLADATMTVTERDRWYQRTATTDASGHYEIPALPAATHEVSAQLTRFQREERRAVLVNVGQTAIVDFQLKITQVQQQVEVSGELPVVNTNQGEQSDVINTQYIMDLPIDRRDYSVVCAARARRKQRHPAHRQPELPRRANTAERASFYGSNGRGNNVTVDGGEANDDAGGVRLTVSQEAVKEFELNRSKLFRRPRRRPVDLLNQFSQTAHPSMDGPF